MILWVTRYLGVDDLQQCSEVPSREGECQVADAIVAISGGDTTARTMEAVRLYQQGWAPRLVFSGAAQDKNSPSNAAVMRDIAKRAGVPEDVITIEEYSRTTKQNAEQTAELLKDDNLDSIILVTSGYHQRRARLEFQKQFGSIKVLSAPLENDRQWSSWWWMTPVGWYLAIGELARIILFYGGVTR